MNGPPLPDDELLSAYLDDEVSAHERAQVDAAVETDRTVRDRLEALRQVRAEVGRPVAPPDDAGRERAIAAALAAHEPADVAPTPAPAPVALDEARARRDARRNRILTGVAAAVVVVLAASLATLGLQSRSANETTSAGSAAAPDSVTGAAAADGGSGATEQHRSSGGTTTVPSAHYAVGPLDFGTATDLAQLEAQVRSTSFTSDQAAPGAATGPSLPPSAEGGTTASSPAAPEVNKDVQARASAGPCEPAARALVPADAGLELTGTATVADRPVVLLGFRSPAAPSDPPADPRLEVVVLDALSCTTVARFPV